MTLRYLKRITLGLSALLVAGMLFSCSSNKNIKYFQDIPDSGALKMIGKAEYTEPKIQVDDILNILVDVVDPLATSMINSSNVTITGSTGLSPAPTAAISAPASGYLVDKGGDVNIPILGKIHLLGLSTTQARDVIKEAALKYYKDPIVIVRFANFKISVTGEVARPGVYVMPNEKVSIMDAIALAGDLTIYGKRENILLIRENLDGTKTPYRVDLRKSDIMSNPYYYLRQNDVIYVEPSKAKVASTDASMAKTYTIIGASLSVLIVFLSNSKVFR